ncbi:chitobiosyldiphosphodolichol beta-mannosyltransferase isoform X2 [Uranotaenia lowii]|nr:chitobiosyldiphosphodolichol beta-mannosyltransferase isoform X2 [Uranotaenia lowii]
MQYHVKSFSESHYNVDLIGYVESTPLEELTSSPNVRIHQISPFPELNLPNLLKYVFKALWQAITLLMTLISIRKPKFILCQNPPAIPTLLVVYVYCVCIRSKFIIDWHNYTHTILGIESSPRNPIVRLARMVEYVLGRKAAGNLCVTRAMQADLNSNWRISSTVLYDRPPLHFHPTTLKEKHQLFVKLSDTIESFKAKAYKEYENADILEETAFTIRAKSGEVKYKTVRPALLISSTSWTADEDFSILVQALDMFESKALEDPTHYPDLICIITGKGPLKEHYRSVIKCKLWKKVKVTMPWLENIDYPKILAAGDLGVCLHYSSSGLDLPMKVVDMFGSGLPVCAVKFNCIAELVEHGKNGFLFETPYELGHQLSEWFYDFPSNIAMSNQKETIHTSLKDFQQLRWTENWKKIAQPLFEQM